MSSITKNWSEEDFRKELRRLDELVKRSQGIDLVGAELDIEFSRARCTLGMYYPKEKKFKFSLLFFNSDVPEACAIDVIRHEYAHYYNDVVFGINHGHGAQFTNAEYREAIKNLEECNKQVDYVITHTAPREIIRRMCKYPDEHDMELTGFLEWIMYEVQFKKWFFGHWHFDREVGEKFRAVWFDVVPVEESGGEK